MMNRTIQFPVSVFLVSLFFAGIGCDDPKQRIAMLEQSNQQLNEDFRQAQDELFSCRQARDAYQSELVAARSEIDSLANSQIQPQVGVPEGWTAVPGGAMIAIEGSVLFAPGKVTLRGGAKRSLEQVLGTLRGNYADKDILIFGHTDDTPIKKSGWQDNYQLSSERALAVVRWLQGRGISPKRLVACGCGEHRPRVPNSSKENREKNRRVEIFALDAEVQTARK